MARQVRPALSKPEPNTDPQGGRLSDEEKERGFHQGQRSTTPREKAGYMRAVTILSCPCNQNPLAHGMGPYMGPYMFAAGRSALAPEVSKPSQSRTLAGSDVGGETKNLSSRAPSALDKPGPHRS